MIKVTREFSFSSAHRLFQHEGKCSRLHGHNYKLTVSLTSIDGSLDSLGRIIDFSKIKELVGTWLDKNWDHKTILYEGDRDLINSLAAYRDDIFIAPFNPTAENMALYLYKDVLPDLVRGLGIELQKVILYETDSCSAEVSVSS